MERTVPLPIASFLIKVHSRCNLMCDYCYEYNCGNTSWRKKPKEMSWEVYTKAVERIVEHAARHSIRSCFFSFHGGEPLLRTPDFFRQAVNYAKHEFASCNIDIEFGMQSNATLLTSEMVKTLSELSIGIGISLDGPETAHNEFRVYSNGLPSYADVRAGLDCLLTSGGRSIWGGFLTVININQDPGEIFDHLASFAPPSTDFLEPHGAWNKLPTGKDAPEDSKYGDWLIRLFDHWFYSDNAAIPIRKFDEIIEHIYGGKGSLESFGLEPVDLITIATDGDYEAVDCIKAAHPEAERLGLNIFEHTLDEVVSHPMISIRQIGLDALPEQCHKCDIVHVCGGGYFAHRYSPENGFRNPSIYCADIKKLVRHIQDALCRTIRT
jgi:uncharacterized protein